MKIDKITIILSEGADLVLCWTNLPSSMPAVTDQNLILEFKVARDGGEQYVRTHFPNIPIKIIGRA